MMVVGRANHACAAHSWTGDIIIKSRSDMLTCCRELLSQRRSCHQEYYFQVSRPPRVLLRACARCRKGHLLHEAQQALRIVASTTSALRLQQHHRRVSLQRPRSDQCSRLMGRASRPREQTTYRVGHAIDRLSLSHVAVRGRPEKASSVARGDALAGWRCSLAAASICSSQLVPPEPPSTLPSRPARNHR